MPRRPDPLLRPSRRKTAKSVPVSLVVGVDPDSESTALAWALRDARGFVLSGLEGGSGSAPWSSVTGQLEWLRAQLAAHGLEPAELVVVVETQAASSPWSADVEALRRVRYHFDAACEIVGARCVHVDKAAWQKHVTPASTKGVGAIKRAYQGHAAKLLGRKVNEDQAAAFGILCWMVESQLGEKLLIEK